MGGSISQAPPPSTGASHSQLLAPSAVEATTLACFGPMLVIGRWGLVLPDGWSAELEEGCACITKDEGVGVLLISHAEKKQTPVARQELNQLAEAELPGDADVGKTKMGDFEGLHATYIAEGERWHRFYLSYGRLLLLISYTVPIANDGDEDDEVIGMLRSLRVRGDRWE